MDLSQPKTPPTEAASLWFADLKLRLANQEAKNNHVLDALNATLQLLTAATQSNQNPLPPLQTTTAVTTATVQKIDLQPALPPNFDGDWQKGKGFINACQAYFRLQPNQFKDKQTKIQWAMTYMNQGRAQKWGQLGLPLGSRSCQYQQLAFLSTGNT